MNKPGSRDVLVAALKADPICNALCPVDRQFIKRRDLPPALNRFAHMGINMSAMIAFGELPHVKVVPAFQMMLEDFESGIYDGKHTIVVDSSGNTAHAVARLAKSFGFRDVKVVLSADVPDTKKGILAALSSVEIIEVAGGKSVAARAKEEAEKPGHYHLNQYAHPGNYRAHELYTGPEIVRACDGVPPAIVAIALGSAGTAYGVARFFRNSHPTTAVLGVRPKLGDQVPGSRDEKRMKDVVEFPWEDEVSGGVIEVSRKDAFIGMRQLWSVVEPQPGPTSGMAWRGLMQHLEGRAHTLDELQGHRVVFLGPDDGRFYSDRTLGELDTGQGLV